MPSALFISDSSCPDREVSEGCIASQNRREAPDYSLRMKATGGRRDIRCRAAVEVRELGTKRARAMHGKHRRYGFPGEMTGKGDGRR